jgi:hypothetical protein
MAGSPRFKVFNEQGDYIASFKDLLDAAQFISLEEGREVRLGHSKKNVIWTNNFELFWCGQGLGWRKGTEVRQSFDHVLDRYIAIMPADAYLDGYRVPEALLEGSVTTR